jgi:hypothetical protein
MGGYAGRERREYLRYRYDKPMKFSLLSAVNSGGSGSELAKAMSRDLSASGILFSAARKDAPKIGSVVVLDLDYRTAAICSEVDERALILDNKLIGRVVRLEDNGNDTFDVGVAFVTKTDPISKNVRKIEDLVRKV